jgi:O-antigen/teichoic acid export membrane protein
VNLLGRLVSGLSSLISIRLLVAYLTNEGYGILATITSMTGWLALTNLGFGLGLQNLLIDAVVRGDLDGEKRLVSTTQIILGTICVIVLAVWIVLFQLPLVSWSRILNVSSPRYVSEVNQAVFWSGVVVLTMVYTSYVQAIYAANQALHRFGIWQVVSQLCGLLGLYLAYIFHAPLAGAVLGVYGVPAGVMLLNSVWLGVKHPGRYLPRASGFSAQEAKRLLKYGGSFTLIGITGALQYGTDNLIISNTLSPSDVTPYAIVMKLFSLFQSFSGSLFMPMWAALANAKSSGDWHWIRKQFGRLRNVVLAANALFVIGMILFGELLIRFWVGATVQPTWALIALLGGYSLVRSWADVHSILCNALDQAPLNAALGIPSGIITVVIMYFFASRLGLNGLAFAIGFSLLLVAGVPLPYIAYRAINRLERHAQPLDSCNNV